MLTTVKRWGNSYAIRLTSHDLRRLGIKEGEAVEVVVQKAAPGQVDLSHIPSYPSRPGETLADVRRWAAEQWGK